MYSQNPEKKPFLKYFYKQPGSLYSVNTPDFSLSINPVIHVAGGAEQWNDGSSSGNDILFINSRGAEVQGVIDNKIAFYTLLTDNQMLAPLQNRLYGKNVYCLPGEAFFKNFKGNHGFDFFHAEGYVAAPVTKHINFQFGNTKQFIGNGMRSLILSDFTKPHLSLLLNTQVWKINYRNIFTELTDSAFATGAGVYNKKFAAIHHLSINISRTLNIGLFESVIFKRNNNAYELNYLNPIIFYRSVEHSLGSPDNVLLGGDFKWNFGGSFQVYGQAVLDEFILVNFRNQFIKSKSNPAWGWWGNKYSAQIGLKYIDMFHVKNLDLQLEYNKIRPYTYSYYTASLNYTDFNQSLAHPLGANLHETYASLRWQPLPALMLRVRGFYTIQGIDTGASVSYGGDILKPSHLRRGEYGNATTQGIKASIRYAEFSVSYRIMPGLFADVNIVKRARETSVPGFQNSNFYMMAGLRLNALQRAFDY